ncbi:MAG: hypothetical protein JW761_03470, partial [Prolixibacteraceae bacterium]|nr:hypothetical protein [Prolixibacteraceae bacterium]
HGHPINEHHHTKTEICFFHSVHLDVYTLPEETVVKNNTHFERRYFLISNERIESSYTESGSTPRAPPSLLS